MDRYSCFDVRKDEGKRLVEVLQDLMKYEDDELRVCSAKLLFDIYKVSINLQYLYRIGINYWECDHFVYRVKRY